MNRKDDGNPIETFILSVLTQIAKGAEFGLVIWLLLNYGLPVFGIHYPVGAAAAFALGIAFHYALQAVRYLIRAIRN